MGNLLDTNTAFIARRLAGDGNRRARSAHHRRQPRAHSRHSSAASSNAADGAIVTGGLGPTVDDVTKEAVCDALARSASSFTSRRCLQMERFFQQQIGRAMRPNNRKQAELPQGSLPLDNPERNRAWVRSPLPATASFVACMPGVPREMKPMLAEKLVPFLAGRFPAREPIYTRIIHTIGIGEIGDRPPGSTTYFSSSENPKIAVLAHDAPMPTSRSWRSATDSARKRAKR